MECLLVFMPIMFTKKEGRIKEASDVLRELH